MIAAAFSDHLKVLSNFSDHHEFVNVNVSSVTYIKTVPNIAT